MTIQTCQQIADECGMGIEITAVDTAKNRIEWNPGGSPNDRASATLAAFLRDAADMIDAATR